MSFVFGSLRILGLLSLLGVVSCPLLLGACTSRDSGDVEDEDDDDAVGDDDDSSGDDDDSGSGDDDDTFDFEDPPVFLAAYDFTLVLLGNDLSGEYSVIHGVMDISVSTTKFLAELVSDDGQEWSWGGALDQNEQAFLVRGYFDVPGMNTQVFMEVAGNFLADSDGATSDSCLTGLGEDDDPNMPNQGVEFAWYGCQNGAPAPAIDRSGTYTVTYQVHGDNCAAWGGAGSVGNWSETWSFSGRRLIVARDTTTGYGIVSDDGNVFRFSVLEKESPGRSLKVIGDFTNPTGTTEARATGYCQNKDLPPGAVIDLDY